MHIDERELARRILTLPENTRESLAELIHDYARATGETDTGENEQLEIEGAISAILMEAREQPCRPQPTLSR